MNYQVFEDKKKLGYEAARKGAEIIRRVLSAKSEAAIILATGASQFEMLENLVTDRGLDWSRITAFHLDEYIGIDREHPASFRNYLRNRVEKRLPDLKAFHYIEGDKADPKTECARIGELIRQYDIDVAFVGIGENSHLAFNDPPADFQIQDPYIVVRLDEDCRKQQMGEGWFKSLSEVPGSAISMSIAQIMRSKAIVVSVPDLRKAKAVKCALEGPVTPDCPSSILQRHNDCHIYLDKDSASLLSGKR